jgi:DinB superfamily
VTHQEIAMPRPKSSEHAPFYQRYIDLVPEADVIHALETQIGETLAVMRGVSESQGNERHPPYTWSIKEVIGHLADSERIFGYRALRFARGDTTPLPGFDENEYVCAAHFDRQKLSDLIAGFEALRRAHVLLFRTLTEEEWSRQGEANGKPMSVRALAFVIAGHGRHHTNILQRRLEKAAVKV